MIKYLTAILLIASTCQQISGQTLTGTVYSPDKKPLSYVSVTAAPAGSQTIQAFTQTNIRGNYSLKLNKYGDWQLTFSSLSFHKDTLHIYVDKDTVRVKSITLQSAPIVLQEVEIRPTTPIFHKKDTVVFNVASFLKGNERVVEDVLKNLPGIEVDQQGTIRANGKEVEKVLLEDDDLLNKGYALLTRGLTAKAIKQVELIHEYNEHRLAAGLAKSNKTALNLKLEDEAKHRWLGTLSADYGTENIYAGQAVMLGASKKDKHYMIANINNTGYAVLTDITQILDMPETDFSAAKLVNMGLTLPDTDLKRCNFNREKMFSDNSIFRPGKKWKIHLSVAANTDKRKSYYQTVHEYKIKSSSFTHALQNQAEEVPRNYIGRATVSFDLSDKEIMESTTQYRHNRMNTNSLSSFNDFSFDESLMTTNDFFSQKLDYTNRFSANDLLRINAHYVHNRIPQFYEIDSLLDDEFRLFKQGSTSKKQQSGVKINYLHRFNNKHMLESHIGIRTGVDEINVSDNFTGLGNAKCMRIKAWNYFGGLLYRFSGKKFSLTGGSTLNYRNVHLTNEDTYLWLTPFCMWEWKPGKRHKLNFSWIYKHDYPSVAEIFPYTVRNSLNISSSGADDIKLLSHWLFDLNYQYGGWTDNLLANVNLTFLKNERYYSSDFYITQDQMYVKKIPLKNKKGADLSGYVNYYISPLSSNIKLSGGVDYINYQYLINQSGSQSYKSIGYTCGLSAKSAFTGIFNFEAGSTYTRKILVDEDTYITKNNLYAALILSEERWNVDVHAEYSRWKGGVHSLSSYYCFLDAEIQYILKPGKWTVSLKGENLLNVNTYVENSINEISQSKYESRLLPRKLLMSIEYKF